MLGSTSFSSTPEGTRSPILLRKMFGQELPFSKPELSAVCVCQTVTDFLRLTPDSFPVTILEWTNRPRKSFLL
jgi:hypothetical protein